MIEEAWGGVGAEVVFTELVKTCPLVSTSVFKKKWERLGLTWGNRFREQKWGRPSYADGIKTWADETYSNSRNDERLCMASEGRGCGALCALSGRIISVRKRRTRGQTLGGERQRWTKPGKRFIAIDSVPQLYNCQLWGHRFNKLFHSQENGLRGI